MIEGLHHLHVWDTLPPGRGTGMEIALRADDGGRPGEVLANLQVTGYMEVPTGRTFFDRDEAQSWTSVDPFSVPAGRYWFEATIVGPEDNLWLTAPLRNQECWINCEDFGGLARGSNRFGVPSDLSWCLSGEVLLDPTGACCLADGSCEQDVPAGACTDGFLGIFHEGRSCDEVTCAPFGACCFLDGSCASFSTEEECLAADGDFRDGQDCSRVDCAVRGACCLDNGSCAELSQADCLAGGGDYQGDGVGCGVTECPAGACCRADGTCAVLTEGACGRGLRGPADAAG